ncbi:chloramphenicol-sensitive protein RarD [Peptoclostridium litorale DSM 5388]|uniref:Protein RarD n=2 Tax=Peptoclostridium litorale TaxID=1557 RepID=A0A069RC03_PEPLI|nr:EamA family transporter RarD [Peptoclostridium litorale]KDR94566.1 protein RarD [Peptoclostridium litorale DSM 5388]SIO31479.1 chloramphenicol-sensitive protein RarD [Peptoclostridium litorale DSM 5388]
MESFDGFEERDKNLGVLSIIFTYTVWGLQPLYWSLLQGVPLIQLLAHRIVWSFVLLICMLFVKGRVHELIDVLKNRKKRICVIACAALISLNWLINIYSVYSRQVVEASLGQYITPIMTIFIGIFILNEKIDIFEAVSLFVALAGVLIMTANLGKVPLVAVLLIVTFVGYTFMKKTVDINPIIGITAEVSMLLPIALACIAYSEASGKGVLIGASGANISMLISTGAFTAIPLLMFSHGVKLVNLSRIGFIQYYAPTLSLILGVFIFKEVFTKTHLISFGAIWTAVIIAMISSCLKRRGAAYRRQ